MVLIVMCLLYILTHFLFNFIFCSGIFEINCSKDLKIQGIIGPCASLEKKGPLCSDVVIGQGGTSAWKMCGLDKSTSLCLFFDVVRKESPDAAIQATSNQFYFQFLTYYQNNKGQMRLRVTTLSRRWIAGPESVQDLIAGFDQEAAAIVMARQVSFKMETELFCCCSCFTLPAFLILLLSAPPTGLSSYCFLRSFSQTEFVLMIGEAEKPLPRISVHFAAEFDPIRWLDKALINVCSRFGEFQKDTPSSFSLSPRLSIFPQFMFHFRRSQFVQVFNNSPDETAYFRMILNRENVANSVVMVQPSLISYSFHSGPEPALLDVAAIAADKILLLDSFFTVVIFHGSTIAQWRKAGYHNEPEHQAFAQFLRAPHDDADLIIKERFPVPRLVICDQHGSQVTFYYFLPLARFLLAKLNPSATYSTENYNPGGDIIFTDDVSFEVFLDHLQRLVVQ
ncbi:hypothetical protein V8G54_010672 [Vigna mungo]|uniref:Protein transport protein SEC23 n=1 Tax=Vigna mungo TaxID=3915 RepID=A0AAQ3NXI8_VIGMU